ncbi:uncharacterized protein LOC112572439 [Pomacea canaliculata]|uniref:uncharacterized protein LOC112572439 n=1 Tax=Pomacea canaliculata TaxID=400727 RepID=UPI000D7319AB|nr:uncharacterized protein LOC112572439 [Pomacea canaliculata]XP_025107917.1 uncharacterized protein LOC112572439 [Pomacea canaliculata]
MRSGAARDSDWPARTRVVWARCARTSPHHDDDAAPDQCCCAADGVRLLHSGGRLNVSSVPCAHYEYYNASAAACVHCDELCLQTVNSDDVAIVEETCADFCPDYIKLPRVSIYSEQQSVQLPVIEGTLIGLMIALLIVSFVIVFLWKISIGHALKSCCSGVKTLHSSRHCCSSADVSDRSYVKLSDPSDEVEIVYRVTCL